MAVTANSDPIGTLRLAGHGPIIPVIVIDRVEDAVPMAEALLSGGIRVLEVTLRTAAALPAIDAIARQVPEAIVGAGTVRSEADARAASNAGAAFAVTPGYLSEIARCCREIALPLLPGVATASEVMRASSEGFSFLKFFPAVAAGSTAMLKALAGPFPDVSFCPTGGLTTANAPDFLALPNVRVCGGSWLTPPDAMNAGDWTRITRLAKEAQSLR